MMNIIQEHTQLPGSALQVPVREQNEVPEKPMPAAGAEKEKAKRGKKEADSDDNRPSKRTKHEKDIN